MTAVKQGSKVEVEYEGRVKDGQMFDTSKEDVAKENKVFQAGRKYEPMKITVGETPLIKGFTDALVGMKEGEEKEVTIAPKDAYGEPNEALRKYVNKENFKGLTPQKNMLVVVNFNGQERPARILDIKENEIQLDFNHPLAGKTLVFKIKMLKIE